MTSLYYSLPGLLIAFGLFRIAQMTLPDHKAVNAIRNIHGKRNMAQRLQAALLPVARFFSRRFPMSEYKAKRMEADFSRLGLTQSPSEYVGAAMAKSMLLALTGLLFVPLGVPWLAFVTTLAALIAYFQAIQSIRKRTEALNREIEAELPRLVETLNYALQDSRDLLAFFEKYRRVAGKALGTELDRLLADMKTGNQEAALRRTDARLGLPSFCALCSILCGVHQGVDQRVSLLVLEQDLRTKEREALRRTMEKKPGRIKTASFILTVLMILMFMVPLVLMIIENLQAVGM